MIRRHSEVLRSLIVRFDHAFKCLVQQGLLAGRILHEVQKQHVVEVASDLLLVVEIEPVVELGELEHNLYGLWLVRSREAAMFFALEYPLAALVDQVWTNRIESVVERLVPDFLLREQHYCSEASFLAWGNITVFLHSFLDVSPNVGSIVSVQIDYGFGKVDNGLGTCGLKNGSITFFLTLIFGGSDFCH